MVYDLETELGNPFEHRPEWIKHFPKDLWDDEHWHAAVKVLPELAAQCPWELKEKLPVQQKNVFVWDSAEKDEKVEYVNIANLQENADNGDMTALFLMGYLQFPPDWEIMMKAACFGDPELYYACICAKTADFGISPAKEREIHQLCYRGRKMNYAPVLNRLAITYLCGIGCKQNLKLAKKYFTQAAEPGMELAQENLDYLTSHNDQEVWANLPASSCDNNPFIEELAKPLSVDDLIS